MVQFFFHCMNGSFEEKDLLDWHQDLLDWHHHPQSIPAQWQIFQTIPTYLANEMTLRSYHMKRKTEMKKFFRQI